MDGSVGHSTLQTHGARKSVHQTAFNQYLYNNGATREDVKNINETILKLIEMAKKQEEEIGGKDREVKTNRVMTEFEMLSQLKRVELRFQELIETRKVLVFFDPNNLKKFEAYIKRLRVVQRNKTILAKMMEDERRKAANLQKRIDGKRNLVVAKHIRATQRSRKVELITDDKEEQKQPPEVEEMRKYLGIIPEEWIIQAQQEAIAQSKPNINLNYNSI